jgi:hypothetical protein
MKYMWGGEKMSKEHVIRLLESVGRENEMKKYPKK